MWCGPETQETQWIVGMVKDVLYNITPELCSFQLYPLWCPESSEWRPGWAWIPPMGRLLQKIQLPCMQKKSSTFSVTGARFWGLFLRRVNHFQQVWGFNVLTKVLLGSTYYEQKKLLKTSVCIILTFQHRYIVTAAHCVTKGQRVWVHIGDHDKTTSSETNSIRYQSTKV